MQKANDLEKQEVTISDLYPELNQQEQAEAEHYLVRYLELVRGIFERINDAAATGSSNLTVGHESSTMRMK
jgi:hypothetical protein